ncbi:MAG TPA: GNAT family N-acetyltransferase, partial [Candidatus Brocadiia bacterium]|nr:GNAT family N-acetyltransferase [Candidatus Brocadiia bacterium]
RAPAWLVDYSRFHVFELPDLGGAPLPPGLASRNISADDLLEVAACRQMTDPQMGVRHMARRFDQRCICVGLQRGQRLAGYAWASAGTNIREDQDRYTMSLGPSGAYIFDTFLSPADRGQGLYEHLIRALQTRLRGQGVKRFFVTVDASNVRSLKAHAKLGARWVESITYWRRLGIETHRAESPSSRRSSSDWPWRPRLFPSPQLTPEAIEGTPTSPRNELAS